MPTYEERSRLIKALSEQSYFDALKDKEPSKDVRIGDRIGNTGRYQVLGADGGVSSNGVKTFNASLPSDGYVRGIKGGNAIALDHRNVKRAEPKRRVEEVAPTFNVIYLLNEKGTKKLYVFDASELREIADFDGAVQDTILGTITRTGNGSEDWIVTGHYTKSSDTSREVQFHITKGELIENDCKGFFAAGSILLLSSQFNIGEEVYNSGNQYGSPITVTAENTAARFTFTTTKYTATNSFDTGHGWIYSAQYHDNLNGSGGGSTRCVGVANYSALAGSQQKYVLANLGSGEQLYISEAPEGLFFDGLTAIFVQATDGDIKKGAVQAVRSFTVQSLVNVPYVDSDGVSRLTRVFGCIISPPIPFSLINSVAIIGRSKRLQPTFTETYFNQNTGFVRRKFYQISVSADVETDVWLNETKSVKSRIGYRLEDFYDEFGPRFTIVLEKEFLSIYFTSLLAAPFRQGLDNETQFALKIYSPITDGLTAKYKSAFIDEKGIENILESVDFFATPEEIIAKGLTAYQDAIVPSGDQYMRNLVGSNLIYIGQNRVGDPLSEISIDLSQKPLSRVSTDFTEEEIDFVIYERLSASIFPT